MNSVMRRLVSTLPRDLPPPSPASASHGRRAAPAEASEIKYIVNNTAITTYDIQKRVAFLKLQRKPGASAKMAADDMVEQVLKSQETGNAQDQRSRKRLSMPRSPNSRRRTRCRPSSFPACSTRPA